jgi:hypothetical protein
VNDFLTPADGVLELLAQGHHAQGHRPDGRKPMRLLPRVRLPHTYIGVGVSQAVLDGHLLNLRKERDVKTGQEDWVDGVENHLGLAKTYARLATLAGSRRVVKVAFSRPTDVPSLRHIGKCGMGEVRSFFSL